MIFGLYFQPVNIQHLTGRELLYLCIDRNVSILAVWCPGCGSKQVKDDSREVDVRCPRCGESYLRLDERFWKEMGKRIRRALRQDRFLLSTVKADCLDLRQDPALAESPPFPFPRGLHWLLPLWRRARKPKGRPFHAARYYRLAVVVGLLRESGLSASEIRAVVGNRPLGQSDRRKRGLHKKEWEPIYSVYRKHRGRLPTASECRSLRPEVEACRKDGMTLEEAIQRIACGLEYDLGSPVAAETAPTAHRAGFKEEGQHLGKVLTEKERRRYSQWVQREVGSFFDPVELWRALTWVHRQGVDRMSRLRGERVKDIKSPHPKHSSKLRRFTSQLSGPSALDEYRFKQISIWVRQDGLSVDDAIEWMAKEELEADWMRTNDVTVLQAEERIKNRDRLWQSLPPRRGASIKKAIKQSVETVEQHYRAVAKEYGNQFTDYETYWRPGVLRDQIEKLARKPPDGVSQN